MSFNKLGIVADYRLGNMARPIPHTTHVMLWESGISALNDAPFNGISQCVLLEQ